MIRPTLLVLALLTALPAAAQIYSWKDKDGRVHYADTPPPTGEIKVIQGPRRAAPPPVTEDQAADETPAAAPPPGDAATEAPSRPQTLEEQNQAFRERRAEQAEAAAKAAEEAARDADRQRFCEQARSQLAALNSGQRVTRFNAAGEREFLDDTARAEEAARLQQQINDNCQ